MKVSLSTNDNELISYANTKREILSLPSQSNFRVYCLIIVSIADKSNLVEYILIEGANCEQGYIGGAICAERSAIVQLRSLNSPKVCKIVITSDADEPISPGCLCREFLLSYCDIKTPLVLADRSGSHVIELELGYLFPHPFIYRYCKRNELESFATEISRKNGNILENIQYHFGPNIARLYSKALEATQKDKLLGLHPLRLGAAILFPNGKIEACWQLKALEYGCTLDPVCQLITIMERCEMGPPDYLICVDQFGNIHAPFAQARALLTEHNYKLINIVVQNDDGVLSLCSAQNLVPTLPSSLFKGSLEDVIFKRFIPLP